MTQIKTSKGEFKTTEMTYQERVQEMATKLAKEWKPDTFDRLTGFDREYAIDDMKPLAILAIAESAEVARKAFADGYIDKDAGEPPFENEYLINNGLVPQTSTDGR